MSEIKGFDDYERYADYANRYSRTINFNDYFGGSGQQASSTGGQGLLADYAAIRNGSYGKLLKAHYAQAEREMSGQGDTPQKLTLLKTSADSLKQSVDALGQASLWEKKKIKTKDPETGEETEREDYDWKAITKAVKSFVDHYNDVVEEAGESDTKGVLRQAMWMTNATKTNASLLRQAGISIGKGNKLELDEDALKSGDISTLKSLFCGFHSYGSGVAQKAEGVSRAVGRVGTGAGYTKNAAYASAWSRLYGNTIDEKS